MVVSIVLAQHHPSYGDDNERADYRHQPDDRRSQSPWTCHGLPLASVAAYLQEVLGQRLTAVIAGVTDAKAVGKWAKGGRKPQGDVERRLRNAYQVAQIVVQTESPETVRAWFIGMNPELDDQPPALVIADDPLRVLQAARIFVANG